MTVRNFLTILLILGLFLPIVSHAQIGEPNSGVKTRVMLLGDSWANFMWTYGSMTEALQYNGFADVKENGNFTSIVGMQAETWASEGWIDVIKARVKALKDADIYVIFIGGNDVVWKWRRDKPTDILIPYADEMLKNTDRIIEEILKINPDGQIVIGGYDYTNFAESMEVDGNPYRDQWEKFGFAPPKMINEALIFFEDYRINYYKNHPNPQVRFINNMGVVQYYGGYPTPSIYEPYGTLEPKTVSLPYGDIRYPNHLYYMGNYINMVPDAFHLNGLGYRFIADNMIRQFIGDYLRKDFNYSFTTDGNYDGWVAASGLTSQGKGAKIGKVDDLEYAGIYTFNTSHFPKGVEIEKGALYLTRKSGVGKLRTGGGPNDHITVEMKVGHFGEESAIEAGDYLAAADFMQVGEVIGNPKADDHKIRVDLTPEVLNAIATAEQIQFRIKVNFGSNPNRIQFFDMYGGETEDKYWAPTLDLKMSEVPVVGIKNQTVQPLAIYPNPAADILNIDIPEQFQGRQVKLALVNTLGSVVKSWTVDASNTYSKETIQLKDIPAGVYNLSVTDGKLISGGNVIVHR
ncbi:MAG TPA: T9SS type A sorting domain-containing protein [Chitinophagales bacterium]|nr:T9SS type A sorting domain-containing protein [Chitinophagales bacterium]